MVIVSSDNFRFLHCTKIATHLTWAKHRFATITTARRINLNRWKWLLVASTSFRSRETGHLELFRVNEFHQHPGINPCCRWRSLCSHLDSLLQKEVTDSQVLVNSWSRHAYPWFFMFFNEESTRLDSSPSSLGMMPLDAFKINWKLMVLEKLHIPLKQLIG